MESRRIRLCKRVVDYVALFVLNAAGMVLEMVAARLLSPYFGSSNFVWTAIIGIILLAGSLGNLLGGKIASIKHGRMVLAMLFGLAGIYLAATPLVDAPVLNLVKTMNAGVEVGSVVSSMVFFLVPATILGMITPIVMKEAITESEDKGAESGRITAIIAIGSLIGTFAGGFFLVPALGTRVIFSLLSVVVVLSIPLLRPLESFKDEHEVKIQKWVKIWYWCGLVMLLVATGGLMIWTAMWSDTGAEISIDTEYGRVIVEDGTWDGEPVRFYKQSGAYSSATYLEEGKENELVFDYLKKYDEMFKFTDVERVLMIGGAAYQYPKYLISHEGKVKMDVVEIDPMSTEIARRYFFLDVLEEKYGSAGEGRLGLFNEDGRVFLARDNEKYDAILNDAFSGEIPVGVLATIEAAELIKKRLVNDGVHISNILGAVEGARGAFLRAEYKTLRQVFRHVYVVPAVDGTELRQYSNWLMFATENSDYRPEGAVEVTLTNEDIVLTDDYCPIDSLVKTDYFSN